MNNDATSSQPALDQELASIIRVQHRLALAIDGDLPRILTNLLPRLLRRIEENSKELCRTSNDGINNNIATTIEIRNQIQKHLVDIVSHAIKRLRGDVSLSSKEWVPNLISMLGLLPQYPLQRTLLVSLLQVGLPRIQDATILNQALEALFPFVDMLHREIIGYDQQNGGVPHQAVGAISATTIPLTLQKTYRSASWLCWDVLALMSYMKPLLDWDMIDFNPSNFDRAAGEMRIATPSIIDFVDRDGVGVFSLILDLLLFRVTPHRPNEPNINVSFEQALSREGYHKVMHRGNGGTAWSEEIQKYLKYLQFSCFRYCVWPFDQGLFRGDDGSVGSSRRLILSLLVESNITRVGRLAADCINKYVGMKRLDKPAESDQFVPVRSFLCNLSTAVSILILVLGDRAASEFLAKHSIQKHLWENILGPIPSHEDLQRPPLPAAVSVRAVGFVKDHLTLLGETNMGGIQLFVDLVVAVHNHHGQAGFGAIHLIHALFLAFEITGVAHLDVPWIKQFRQQCIEASVAVLSVTTRERAAHVAPTQRNDTANLIERHRTAKRKRSLWMDDALTARMAAYDFFAKLMRDIDLYQLEKANAFQIPILLMQCAESESGFLEPKAIRALMVALDHFKQILEPGNIDKFQGKPASILPALLSITCSDSAKVKKVGLEWINQFLYPLDPHSAVHLLDYLASGNDVQTSQKAMELVEKYKPMLDAPMMNLSAVVSCIPSDQDEGGLEQIYSVIQERALAVLARVNIPENFALLILRENHFCVEKTVIAIETDAKYSWLRDAKIGGEENITDSVCAVCLEDLTPESSFCLQCNHSFCLDCYKDYIKNKAAEGPNQFLSATCPSQSCRVKITGRDIKSLVPELIPQWRRYLLESFVENDAHYRFCPYPDCQIILQSSDKACDVATCEKCHFSCCFQCGEMAHSPAQCRDLVRWNKTFDSKLWIQKNTKPCPGCNTPIEKNQGCNHITCSQCSYNFCWICLTELHTHLAPHECNVYSAVADNVDGVNSEERNRFFTTRFQAHEEAEFHAKKKLDATRVIVELGNRYLDEADLDVVVKVRETLLKARTFLKNTYVAAYNMDRDTRDYEKEEFEGQQGAIESFVEMLSVLAEKRLETLYADYGERMLDAHIRKMSFYVLSIERSMERLKGLLS